MHPTLLPFRHISVQRSPSSLRNKTSKTFSQISVPVSLAASFYCIHKLSLLIHHWKLYCSTYIRTQTHRAECAVIIIPWILMDKLIFHNHIFCVFYFVPLCCASNETQHKIEGKKCNVFFCHCYCHCLCYRCRFFPLFILFILLVDLHAFLFSRY